MVRPTQYRYSGNVFKAPRIHHFEFYWSDLRQSWMFHLESDPGGHRKVVQWKKNSTFKDFVHVFQSQTTGLWGPAATCNANGSKSISQDQAMTFLTSKPPPVHEPSTKLSQASLQVCILFKIPIYCSELVLTVCNCHIVSWRWPGQILRVTPEG